jgi:hypothetical protein
VNAVPFGLVKDVAPVNRRDFPETILKKTPEVGCFVRYGVEVYNCPDTFEASCVHLPD